jgi:hypothetical protein
VMGPREAITWCFVRALWYHAIGEVGDRDGMMARALILDALDKLPAALHELARRCIRCGGALDPAERGPDHIDCLWSGVPVVRPVQPS